MNKGLALLKADFRVIITENEMYKVDCCAQRKRHQPVDAFKYKERARKTGKSSARQKGGFTNLRALLALPEGAIYYI